ncbi:MAG: TaqI family restriction endonuclease, partial [Alphaproteobacteria bacterium]|nr:TaqI family restriction endonuclease [Alphaproteobacteria bacterium]
EARIQRNSDNSTVTIRYCVPQRKDFESPRYKKTNEIKPQMLDFCEFSEEGILDRYENGFVVFITKTFDDLMHYFQ